MRPEDTALVFGIEKDEFLRILRTFQAPAHAAGVGS